MQLTVQMSKAQQQLEEKRRLHSNLQFQIQGLALQEQSHALSYSPQPPPSYYQQLAPPTYPGSNVLPDFSSLSLEDAEWFHEGIPR